MCFHFLLPLFTNASLSAVRQKTISTPCTYYSPLWGRDILLQALMPVCITIVLENTKSPLRIKSDTNQDDTISVPASRDCSRRLPSAFWKIIIRGRGTEEIKRCIECMHFVWLLVFVDAAALWKIETFVAFERRGNERKYVLFVCNKIVKWHVHTKSLNMFYIFRLPSPLLRNSFPPFEKLLYKHAIEGGEAINWFQSATLEVESLLKWIFSSNCKQTETNFSARCSIFETTPTSIGTPAAFPSIFINAAHPPELRPCPAISNNKHCRAHLNERHSIAVRERPLESLRSAVDRKVSRAIDMWTRSDSYVRAIGWKALLGPGSKNVNRSCSCLFVQHPSNGNLPRSDVFTPFPALGRLFAVPSIGGNWTDFVFTFPGAGHAEEWK